MLGIATDNPSNNAMLNILKLRSFIWHLLLLLLSLGSLASQPSSASLQSIPAMTFPGSRPISRVVRCHTSAPRCGSTYLCPLRDRDRHNRVSVAVSPCHPVSQSETASQVSPCACRRSVSGLPRCPL